MKTVPQFFPGYWHMPLLFLAMVYLWCSVHNTPNVFAPGKIHISLSHTEFLDIYKVQSSRVHTAHAVVFTFADMSHFRSILMMILMTIMSTMLMMIMMTLLMTLTTMMTTMMKMMMVMRLHMRLSSPLRIWVASGAFANSDPTCPHHPDPLCTWQTMTFMVTMVAFMMTKWRW